MSMPKLGDGATLPVVEECRQQDRMKIELGLVHIQYVDAAPFFPSEV
jgi:hypothetical protein